MLEQNIVIAFICVIVGAFSLDVTLSRCSVIQDTRGDQVMLASKQRYGYEKTDEAPRVRSLLETFEGPMGKRKNEDSDSDGSDDLRQSKVGRKKGTPMYHFARALDKMLMQAGVGGLAAWIEEEPPCMMLSPTEYRYETKVLAPFLFK